MFKFITEKGHHQSMQLALFIAMLSVAYQQSMDIFYAKSTIEMASIFMIFAGTGLFIFDKLKTHAIDIFVLGLTISFFMSWYAAANHTWLAVWTLAPLILFSTWWEEKAYSRYLQLTLGIVMIAAGIQKIIAETYIDGSYIAWMNMYGSTTEQAYSFLCSSSGSEICGWYALLSIVAVIWQLLVGLLLILGFKNWFFILIEIGFLVSVGLFADEMNFQVLNIALLCIAFRFGMPLWLAILCFAFLNIDLIGISNLIDTLHYGIL